jgi:hypothetical protein
VRGVDEPETVSARLVATCIEARDHPLMQERDATLGDLSLVLEDIVRARLAGDRNGTRAT